MQCGPHSYQALVCVVIISLFIVEINKWYPQEDAEEYDGVKCYVDTKEENKLKNESEISIQRS